MVFGPVKTCYFVIYLKTNKSGSCCWSFMHICLTHLCLSTIIYLFLLFFNKNFHSKNTFLLFTLCTSYSKHNVILINGFHKREDHNQLGLYIKAF